MADGYTYSDRYGGGRLDADHHIAELRRVIGMYPDRRIELRDRLDGEGTTVLIGTWTGTPAADGDPMALELALVLSTDGAQVREGAAYYLE